MNKILIVDDDKSTQMLYAEELTEEGYEVITCGDGSELMELINQESPDLIVMDIRLGQYNGLDLLQDIRNAYYDLPLILCTAYPTFKYDLKSIAADYYVLKSSNLDNLKLKIKMALRGETQALSSATHSEVYEGKAIPVEQIGLEWWDTD